MMVLKWLTLIPEINNGFMARFQISHLKPDWPAIEDVNNYEGDDALDTVITKAFGDLFELHFNKERYTKYHSMVFSIFHGTVFLGK